MHCLGPRKVNSRDGIGKRNQGEREEERKKGEEKKTGFLFEKGVFSRGSMNRENPLRPRGPLPGQETIRLAKK